MKLLAITLAIVLPLGPANADEASHKAAAEEFLTVTRAEQMLLSMQAQQKQNIGKMMSSFVPKTMSPEQIAAAQQSQSKVFDYVQAQLSWESLKPDFIQAYVDVFTEAEIRELVGFYKSPIGQKFLEKTPQLTARSMEIMQKRLMTILPEIQKMSAEAVQAVKKSSPAPAAE